MGTVYRKTYTKRLPKDAELFTRQGRRWAKWREGKRRSNTAVVITGRDGSDRIRVKTSTYTAKYRDGSGVVVERSTGCRDQGAARAVLAEWEKKAERVRAGLVTTVEHTAAEFSNVALSEHIGVYVEHLRARQVSETHWKDRQRYLSKSCEGCGFSKLRDLDGALLERWLSDRAQEGMSARTRNAYRAGAVAFANWCVSTHRLLVNPFDAVHRANEKADPRRQRRAMTEKELEQLLEAAYRRPLLDARTIRRGR